MSSGQTTCRACGYTSEAAGRFCGRCGEPLDAPAAAVGLLGQPTQLTEAMPEALARASAEATRRAPGVAVPLGQSGKGGDERTERLPRRRRRTGCVALLGALLLVVALGALGYLFRLELAPSVGRLGLPNLAARMEDLPTQRVRVLLPEPLASQPDGRPRVHLTYDFPRPPEGFQRVGGVFDISLPGGKQSPAVVRLSLPEPRAVGDPARAFYVGRYDGTRWSVYPASVEDGLASAEVPGFSRFTLFVLIRRSRPDPGEGPRLGVPAPNVWGLKIRGADAWAELDLSPCRTAFPPDSGWSRGVRVERLRVHVARPDRTLPDADPRARRPSPRDLAPYAYRVTPGADPVEVVLPALPVGGTQRVPLELDLGHPLRVGPDDTVQGTAPWLVAVSPIFSDGSEGRRSPPVMVSAGVAEAYAMLRAGLAARMGAGGAAFLAASEAKPFYVWLNDPASEDDRKEGYLGNATARDSFSLRWNWQTGGVSLMALTPHSEWMRVISHEWGHYAAHVMWGDAVVARTPSGAHAGWREAPGEPRRARALAFSEDVATWLGQYATGRGVPEGAGAMMARYGDYARRPEGNDTRSLWPNDRDMDAARVESIGAGILARLSAPDLLGFARVYDVVRASAPRDVVSLYAAVTDGLAPADVARVQRVFLDEGIRWRVRGQVVGRERPEAEPQPLEGARVRALALDDSELGAEEATTDAQGAFELTVPVGSSFLRVALTGWRATGAFPVLPKTHLRTNDPPQALDEPLRMERAQQPVVALTAPAAGARVTERLLTVTGTVEGTDDGSPTGRPVERVRLEVGTDRYEVVVADGRFSQRIVIGRGPVTIRAVATNRAGDGEASVTVQSDVEATYARVVLTWAGQGTDLDLWVTDPEGVETGFSRMRPSPGRQLDLDDRDGLGPETWTMTRLVPGTYRVRVNFFRGRASDDEARRAERETFVLRWVTMEGTPQERRGEETGTVSAPDGNAGRPEANRTYSFELAAPPPSPTSPP